MSRNRKAVVAATIFAAPLAIAALILAVGSGDADDSAPPGRTLLVSRAEMPPPSRADRPLHALRVSGAVPRRPTSGTVLTDEQCAPDARGVSHCLNEINLSNGQVLRVRHPHRMMDVACLAPGERVTVAPA